MQSKRTKVLWLLFSMLLMGSMGTGWLLAGHLTAGYTNAPSSAPGTLPAADRLPPPWQVAPAAAPVGARPVYRSLHEIARTVTCMVDGELVKEVLTERAQEKVFQVDPKDKWAAGDNWDYNHEPFVRIKQALERAGYLAAGQVTCNLYMPAAANPKQWYLVMNTVYGGKQMMNSVSPDGISGAPDPELVQVFMTGARLEVSKDKGQYSVLTPVYDSLGQITAVVEVFTRDEGFGQVRK